MASTVLCNNETANLYTLSMGDLQHEGYQVSPSCEGGRRKRPRVAEENRQRASRAYAVP